MTERFTLHKERRGRLFIHDAEQRRHDAYNLSVEDDAQTVCDLLNQLDARANHDAGDPEELDFDDETERMT